MRNKMAEHVQRILIAFLQSVELEEYVFLRFQTVLVVMKIANVSQVYAVQQTLALIPWQMALAVIKITSAEQVTALHQLINVPMCHPQMKAY